MLRSPTAFGIVCWKDEAWYGVFERLRCFLTRRGLLFAGGVGAGILPSIEAADLRCTIPRKARARLRSGMSMLVTKHSFKSLNPAHRPGLGPITTGDGAEYQIG